MGNAKGHPAVPELASYGLMFMLICLALIVVVRWLEARK